MKIFICLLIFLTMFIVSCDEQPLPPDPFTYVQIDYLHTNYQRTDFLSMRPKIHYKGKVQHFGGELKELDTVFADVFFRSNFFDGIADSVLWKIDGNLPDPKETQPSFYTLSLRRANGQTHTIVYSKKIPEIDSLRSRFEQFYLKLLP